MHFPSTGSFRRLALVDDIAREAGVGVGTLYRRFPDKEALVEALFEGLPSRGIRRVVAISLRENHGFERLARRAGLRVERADGDTLHWSLALQRVEAAAHVDPAESEQ